MLFSRVHCEHGQGPDYGSFSTCELVELECEGYGEEEELVCHRDEESYGEVVVVQHMDCGRHLGRYPLGF